jgi:hypothetical protein
MNNPNIDILNTFEHITEKMAEGDYTLTEEQVGQSDYDEVVYDERLTSDVSSLVGDIDQRVAWLLSIRTSVFEQWAGDLEIGPEVVLVAGRNLHIPFGAE